MGTGKDYYPFIIICKAHIAVYVLGSGGEDLGRRQLGFSVHREVRAKTKKEAEVARVATLVVP